MKKSLFYSLIFFFLALTACQKEDMSFSLSGARITKITETGVDRNFNDNSSKFPYQISFIVSASLNDITDIQEWGVYFVDPNTKEQIEFSFKEVARTIDKELVLNTIPECLHKGEQTSYIEADRRIGLYIKKKDKNGNLKTYYGDLTTYTVHYDFPSTPSVEYSNPQIVSSEMVSEQQSETTSVRKYKTTYSYDLIISGGFWIDHLENCLSTGWSWDKESNYSLSDGKHTRTITMTYSPGPVDYSQWTVIHCYDTEETIESKNWLNLSGDPSISKIEVSNYERKI